MDSLFNEKPSDSTVTSDLEEMLTQQRVQWREVGFTVLTWAFAAATVWVMLWMIWIIARDARPAIEQFGWAFLWNRDWDINDEKFGALPFIYGTIVTSGIALILAIPVGLSVALVTSEDFLPSWLREILGFLIELIAAIPSVIIGLWGIVVLVPWIQPLQVWLYNHLRSIPLFKEEPFGPSMLVAGVLLSIMILPTIAAISRDILLSVPQDLKSASMALGATRWETIWRTLLPFSSSGIIGAVMLGLGRALGETMAVTMVIGNSIQMSPSLLAPGYTIPAVLANQFAEALDAKHVGALLYLALVLFMITLLVNIAAVTLVQLISFRSTMGNNRG